MTLNLRHTGILIASISFAAAPATVSAQEGERPMEQTVLAFEGAGIGSMFGSPKDAALQRAIMMIPERLRELPREIPDAQDAPPGLFDLIDLAFHGPYRLAVVNHGSDPETGMPRVSAELAIGAGDRAGAEAAHDAVVQFAGSAPQLSRAEDGSLMMQTPAGPARMNAYEDGAGRWWWGARIGNPGAVERALNALPQAPGGETLMRGSMDLESIVTPMKMMGAMMAGGDPDAAAGMAMIESLGILDALSLPMDTVVWRDGDGVHARTVAHNARQAVTRMGFSEQAISEQHLRAIPADAIAAHVSRSDMSVLLGVMEMLKSMGPGVQRGLDMFTEETGVDIENDFIRALDGVFAFYASDATGGSGLMSWVAIAGVRDHDALSGALHKLSRKADQMAQGLDYGQSNGRYIRIAMEQDRRAGVDLLTLRTPGFPAPLNPTIALTDRWLIVGMSRQAASAAALQATDRGDAGLLANESFRRQWPGAIGEAIQLQFLDTPRAVRKGYGMTNLLGGMLENTVRSALGEDRDPGMVVPPYNELVRDARAMIEIVYWEGDDLVTLAHADDSVLVNAAGMLGVYVEPILLMGAPAIMLPAIERARENAARIQEEQRGPGF